MPSLYPAQPTDQLTLLYCSQGSPSDSSFGRCIIEECLSCVDGEASSSRQSRQIVQELQELECQEYEQQEVCTPAEETVCEEREALEEDCVTTRETRLVCDEKLRIPAETLVQAAQGTLFELR